MMRKIKRNQTQDICQAIAKQLLRKRLPINAKNDYFCKRKDDIEPIGRYPMRFHTSI